MKRRFTAEERAIIAWIERDKRRALTPHEIKFVLMSPSPPAKSASSASSSVSNPRLMDVSSLKSRR